MISLIIVLSLYLLSLIVTAWLLGFSARRAGSLRGRFGVGLIAAMVLWVCIVALEIASLEVYSEVRELLPLIAFRLLLLCGAGCVIFFVLKYAFALNTKRALVPFAAYLAWSFVGLVATVRVIRPYVVQALVLNTPTMIPTLNPGDRVIVDKWIHPHRFDLVVYRSAESRSTVYCKRLIGLPGERLRFDGGGLYINDQPVVLAPVLAGRCHASPDAARASHARYKDGETILLGSDEYFVIGDNVAISADSRSYGPTKAPALVGVVDTIYWPWPRARIVR